MLCVMCINIYLYFVFITESKWERERKGREILINLWKFHFIPFHPLQILPPLWVSLFSSFSRWMFNQSPHFFQMQGEEKQAKRHGEAMKKMWRFLKSPIDKYRIREGMLLEEFVRGRKKLLSMDIFFMLCWEFCIVCFHHVSLEIIVALFTLYVSPPLGLLKDNIKKMR